MQVGATEFCLHNTHEVTDTYEAALEMCTSKYQGQLPEAATQEDLVSIKEAIPKGKLYTAQSYSQFFVAIFQCFRLKLMNFTMFSIMIKHKLIIQVIFFFLSFFSKLTS